MFRSIYIFLFLAACASPSQEFNGSQKSSLLVDGDEITVFYNANRAQAVRTNFRTKLQQKGALSRLKFAIETVTKCEVDQDSVEGSITIIAADLKCPA